MHIIKNPYINSNKNSKRTEKVEETTKEAKKIVITIIFIINGHHHHIQARLQQWCFNFNAYSTDLLRGKNYNQIFVIKKRQHIRKKVSSSYIF